MRKSRCTEIQILRVVIYSEAETPMAEIVRTNGISRNMYFAWKSKYAGATVSEMPELKAANPKSKPTHVKLALEHAALKNGLNGKL